MVMVPRINIAMRPIPLDEATPSVAVMFALKSPSAAPSRIQTEKPSAAATARPTAVRPAEDTTTRVSKDCSSSLPGCMR
ncbi:hypothetical protein B7495_18090 (plasmid) [Cryobacterium sp. LW097]|nr:hypothetical protein B7495_18090 [Cryobacterium sp. LW097]